MIASPCINICSMNAHTQLCEGCGRTLDEIAIWGSSGDEQKQQILHHVAQRNDEQFARLIHQQTQS